MMKVLIATCINFCLIAWAIPTVKGQITSSADAKDTIIWSKGAKVSDYKIDTIYVFNKRLGDLSVRKSDTVCKFQWFKLDTVSKTYQMLWADTAIFKDSSIISGLSQGGYSVVRTSAKGTNDSTRAWVYRDSVWLGVTKTTNGQLQLGKYTCSNVELNAIAGQRNFVYYKNKKAFFKNYSPFYTWSALPAIDGTISPKASPVIDTPTAETTTFTAKVFDYFKIDSISDDVKFNTVRSKVEFTWAAKEEDHVIGDTVNSAPFEVIFTNKSTNIGSFTYRFGDGTPIESNDIDTITKVSHIYTYPKKYEISLIIESKQGCIDSMYTYKDENDELYPVVVAPSEFKKAPEAANVFHPGSNTNDLDVFKFYSVSIGHYNVQIFSRWGRLIYEDEGDDMLKFEWKGNILKTAKEAPDGLYYYVLRVTPFSWSVTASKNKIENGGKYSGYVYLIRAK